MSILQKIEDHKKLEVAQAKKERPLSQILDKETTPTRDFIGSITAQNGPAIIAEIKKASPSKGILREPFHVAEIAKEYEQNGACCLSVLTDIAFFQGHPDNIHLAKSSCNLPVLRKDFVIDPYQIYESRALGADCILLIAAMLDDAQLHDFCAMAHELQMAVLVESHTHKELERAIKLPTKLIGINNRDLNTFAVDIQTSIVFKDYVPSDKIIVTESGIMTHQDISLLQSHGINTFLIGESLMKAANIGQALASLIGTA